MSNRQVAALATALAAVAVSVLSAQQGAPAQPPPVPQGTARVVGRVVAADTGATVPNARVKISALQFDASWIASTDDEGRFDLQRLPAATYNISIQKAGFVDATPPSIQIKDAVTLDRGDIKLVRGGVITGRIIDSRGDPVVDASVGAAGLRYRTPGSGSLYPVQSARTNDLGEFRLYGLQAGNYYVYAGFGGTRTLAGGAWGMPRVFYAGSSSAPALTFYPGASRAVDAQAIEVKNGEVSFVDLRLISVPLATVSGRVVDSKGQPAQDVVIMMTQPVPYGALNFKADGVVPDSQGRFSINNVQPGDYHLDALSRGYLEAMGREGSTTAAARALGEYGSADITVAGDVKDLVVQTTKGFEVRGRVIVDGGAMPSTWIPKFSLRGGLFSGQGEVSGDGSFVLRAMDGHRRIQAMGMPSGAMVESVLVRGREATDDGFDVSGDIVGVEVAITLSPPMVAGRVVNARGETVEGAVIVYAERAELWTKPDARYVKSGHSTVDQGFRIVGLPPGRYLAVALEQLDEFDWANPANLERLRANAIPISLSKGETKTILLTRR